MRALLKSLSDHAREILRALAESQADDDQEQSD